MTIKLIYFYSQPQMKADPNHTTNPNQAYQAAHQANQSANQESANCANQGPVIQRMDNTIHRPNHCPVDGVV